MTIFSMKLLVNSIYPNCAYYCDVFFGTPPAKSFKASKRHDWIFPNKILQKKPLYNLFRDQEKLQKLNENACGYF